MIRALLLDFDGLLYDTESSAYGTWAELFAEQGAHLSLRTWVGEVIGRPPGASRFDPLVELERLTGQPFDRDGVLATRDARRRAMLPHHLMPGADELLAGARDAGLATAIVTSNSLVNVTAHLARAGSTHRFDAIVCADGDPVRGKPAPTLYLEALERLGLPADEAIAIEDSPNGVAAAQAAGLYCIAVPSEITRGAPGLEAADRTISSLAELRPSELSRSRSVPQRIRRHGRRLARSGRSRLYVALIAAAADDYEAGGVVARMFAGVDVPPGAVPSLRLMAALHELALTRREPELSAFYPSAGGTRSPDHVWPVAREALERNFDWIELRLHRTVQTNEPGRSAALYPVLLWLTAAHGRPLRLLEIGASAGLNLICDRYRYDVGELTLGDPDSPVRFEEPWRPAPGIDLAAATAALRITHREGCDPNPLDPSSPDDRRRLISYIWPDEPDRLARLDAALSVAAPRPPMVVRAQAIEWLPDALSRRRDGELTVIWHSVMRQYVDPAEWQALFEAFAVALAACPERPIVWVGMEPIAGGCGDEITLCTGTDRAATRVASCADHGPTVVWELGPDQPIG
ncbi:MAG: HAD-IA family hydrolase [Solirubrobacteraceae bacterium]